MERLEPDEGQLVVVTVGTDHHPFDRLMGWIGDWIETRGGITDRSARPIEAVEVVVQHGPSTPPPGTRAEEVLELEVLTQLLGRATAVVCSAGPGAVMTARKQGRLPIVVARRKGEAVDDHQVAFTELLEHEGLALVARTASELANLLDRVLADPGMARVPVDAELTPLGVTRVGPLIDELMARSC